MNDPASRTERAHLGPESAKRILDPRLGDMENDRCAIKAAFASRHRGQPACRNQPPELVFNMGDRRYCCPPFCSASPRSRDRLDRQGLGSARRGDRDRRRDRRAGRSDRRMDRLRQGSRPAGARPGAAGTAMSAAACGRRIRRTSRPRPRAAAHVHAAGQGRSSPAGRPATRPRSANSASVPPVRCAARCQRGRCHQRVA